MGHFCLNCGHPLSPRVIEGRPLEACDRCSFVLWRDPKVVTMVVVEAGQGIVLGRRGIEPGYGRWCLPGGFVNDDEHPAAAAARECREEIAAEVEILDLLGVYQVTRSDGSGMVALGYRGRLRPGAAAGTSDEMLEVRVFPPRELPELAFSSHREAMADWMNDRLARGEGYSAEQDR